MIISYQLGKFCFTEFDQDWNEHSQIWKIADFYTDFPFLPQLDFNEIGSISFEDDRDLYLITYHPKLKKEAVGGYSSPSVHPFLKAIEDNKETIRNRAYELMTVQETPTEPPIDIVAELNALKAKISKIENDIDAIKGNK